MQGFRNLNVWKKAHELVLEVYRVSQPFPRSEMFGLTSQLRRAASSIAANLAEGCGRTQSEFAHYVQISFGSASELEYHLLLARDLGLLDAANYERNTQNLWEIKKMLSALLTRVRLSTRERI
ncbi:MAG: four helix bundle protein [Candidatus Korobacteraceae bacterium]